MSDGIYTTPLPVNEPILGYMPGSPERKQVESAISKFKSETARVPLIINGEEVFSGESIEIAAPHDHSLKVATLSCATQKDIENAITTGLNARKAWANLPWQDRAAVFLKAADLLAGPYRAEMNAATMLSQSKNVFQAEIDAACELADFFRFNAYYLEGISREQPIHNPNGQWNRLQPRGLEGFVFAIAPFNFSSISVNLAAAPALMGCSVLWKPSPTCALASYVGYKVLREAGLPAGVINMVQGDPKMIGEVAMKHPELSGVHFTGSTATFNHLWKQVGENIENYKHYPRIVGETGGKDFVFAEQSCDVKSLAHCLIRGAFEYQGQKCSAASRAYVPKSIWPELETLLKEEVAQVRMGDPCEYKSFMGAVIDERAFNKIEGYLKTAKSSPDAEVIIGGECDDSKGYFISPTVILAKKPTYETMIDELFGPVLTIYVYDDDRIEETLQFCDTSTKYALTGAIFAKDRAVINKLTTALEGAAGNFYINDKPTGAVVGQQPFGGARASGTNDKAGSKLNLLRWTSMRTIKENFMPVDHFSYPYMKD